MSGKINITLKSRLRLVCLLLVTLPILSLSMASIYISGTSTEKSFLHNSGTLAKIAEEILTKEFESYEDVLESIINGSLVDETGIDFHILKENMKVVMDSNKSIVNIYLAQTDNNMVFAQDLELPEDFTPSELPWFKETMDSSESYIFHDPYLDTISNTYMTSVYKKFERDNKIYGVLALDIDLGLLSEKISTIKYGEKGELILVDSEGMIISNSGGTKVGTTEPLEYSVWEDIKNNESGRLTFRYEDIKYQVVYNTTSLNGWKTIVKIPSIELKSGEVAAIKAILLLIVILVIISVIISWKMAQKFTKSINRIKDAVEGAATGKFDERIEEDNYVKEIEVLGKSFNNMVDSIADLIGSVNESALSLNDNAASSANMSEEISASMTQVSQTISEISGGTVDSANSLEVISDSMNRLSNSIEGIKGVTVDVDNMASQTNKFGKDGIIIVKDVIEISNETKASTEEVRRVVSEVSESIENIKAMNEAISNITEQTNLLALNAAIEAARAGEAGKGFAVVADEIMALADETAKSARRIDEVIKEINEKSDIAVSRVEETTAIVDNQQQSIKKSEEIFTSIVSSVEELAQRLNEIVSGLNTVEYMKNNVLDQVKDLSIVLEGTAAGAEEVSASAEEVTASTNEFIINFSELKDMAENLKEQVSKFEI